MWPRPQAARQTASAARKGGSSGEKRKRWKEFGEEEEMLGKKGKEWVEKATTKETEDGEGRDT